GNIVFAVGKRWGIIKIRFNLKRKKRFFYEKSVAFRVFGRAPKRRSFRNKNNCLTTQEVFCFCRKQGYFGWSKSLATQRFLFTFYRQKKERRIKHKMQSFLTTKKYKVFALGKR